MAQVNITAWAKKANLTLDQAAKGITIKLFTSVVTNTRVDTGRLRGNWQISLGSPITSTTDRKDKSGSKVLRDITGKVKAGKVNILTNNLPYAEVWEEKDAMVARSLARISRIIRESVGEAK